MIKKGFLSVVVSPSSPMLPMLRLMMMMMMMMMTLLLLLSCLEVIPVECQEQRQQHLRTGMPQRNNNNNNTVSTERLLNSNNNHRDECPRNKDMVLDSAWYEFSMSVLSYDPIECSDREWRVVKRFLQEELEDMDLYKKFGITSLETTFCKHKHTPHPNRRRTQVTGLTDTDSGTDQRRVLTETTSHQEAAILNGAAATDTDAATTFQRGMDANDARTAIDALVERGWEEHRELADDKLSAQSFVYQLFFRGGGRCWFCKDDDKDGNGVRRRRLGSSFADNKNNTVTTGTSPPFSALDILTGERDSINTEFFLPPTDPIILTSPQNGNETDNGDSTVSPSLTTRRVLYERPARRLKCGGCMTIDFSVDGKNKKIPKHHTPYMRPGEYWNSHGVQIKAQPAHGTGYAPYSSGRLYDTSYRPKNSYDGDIDLGSPNAKCPGGGPGRGVGGEPKTRRGDPNPGANCKPQGHVLIIQESDKDTADDNRYGGSIIVRFRYPVLLKTIGLMDMNERTSDHVTVHTEDKKSFSFAALGYGDNSIETLDIYLEKVKWFEFKMRSAGALRDFSFCHDCGKENAALEADLVEFYSAKKSAPTPPSSKPRGQSYSSSTSSTTGTVSSSSSKSYAVSRSSSSSKSYAVAYSSSSSSSSKSYAVSYSSSSSPLNDDNQDMHSKEALEDIQNRVSKAIGDKLQYQLQNKYTNKRSHCLYRKDPIINFELSVSTSERATSCKD